MFTETVTATIRGSVTVGRRPLSPLAERNLMRVVVDTHLHLPDMFELTFLDSDGGLLDRAGIEVGSTVTVSVPASGGGSGELTTGEVTAIEALCENNTIWTVVRGYSKLHRLQRARRTRTFVNMTDADVARRIAVEHRLEIGEIEATRTAHAHLAQIAQTDWEFLTQRAREIGYEVGISRGKFHFRALPAIGGGSLGSLAGGLLPGGTATLRFKENLYRFAPRLTAATMVPEVEVRVWDASTPKVVTAKAATRASTADVGSSPAKLAKEFTAGGGLAGAAPGLPMAGAGLGPAPAKGAYVVVDHPVGTGQAANAAAGRLARAAADQVGAPFAEAEGTAQGDSRVRAGEQVKIDGVPVSFVGTWLVTRARHVLEDDEGGYLIHFEAGGGQDRSLLGLTSRGAGTERRSPLRGLVCGIVTNNNDPQKKGRVKISLPWLSPQHESDWARVAQPGIGRKGGLMVLPEVGDEVLVGFEFDDPRRPYVVGGLVNGKTKLDLGGPAIKPAGRTGSVARTGIVSGSGSRLVFRDELPPSGGPPTASSITLGTGDNAIAVLIDQSAGALKLNCRARKGPGQILLECANGNITIKAKNQVSIVSANQLNLEGSQVTVKARAALKLEAGGPVEVKGAVIKLN